MSNALLFVFCFISFMFILYLLFLKKIKYFMCTIISSLIFIIIKTFFLVIGLGITIYILIYNNLLQMNAYLIQVKYRNFIFI